jgi:hypothetical protein
LKLFQFDCSLALLLTLILLFNPDFNPLLTRSVVEPIQLKYVILLQRYLRWDKVRLELFTFSLFRYKMCPEMANKKFLEAMLLLSYTRELREINNLQASPFLSQRAVKN